MHMSATARLCENLITKGRTAGMEEKLSQLMLFGQLQQEEYSRLMELFQAKTGTVETV